MNRILAFRLIVLCCVTLKLAFAKGLGGTFFALGGKNCVVMATDARYSGPRNGGTFIVQDPRRIYKIGDHTLFGSFGLESDADSLAESVQRILQRYFLDSGTTYPNHIAKLLSLLLYSGQFVSTPLVAGLLKDGNPYLCSMDGIGAQTQTDTYAVVGTSSDGLLAICENLYEKNLSAPALAALAEKCLRLAFQRDALSGGGKIKIVTLWRRNKLSEWKNDNSEAEASSDSNNNVQEIEVYSKLVEVVDS